MAGHVITKRVVDSAAPSEAEFTIWDAKLKGFGLRVRPTGAKTYVVHYRSGRGRKAPTRKLTIGMVGKLTPDEARELAKKALGSVAHGEDPAADRSESRKAMTVEDLAEAFLSEHVEAKRKPSTASKYRYVIRAFVIPALGKQKPSNVTRASIGRLHHELRDRPTIANYTMAVISAMYTFAEGKGIVAEGSTPTRRLELYTERARERFLNTDEIGRLADAIREAETTGLPWTVAKVQSKHLAAPERRITRFDPNATAALRLLLLTGCRLREILNLRWSEVDLERGMLFLEDSKTGRKSVLLNAPALSILTDLPRLGPCVVPGEDPAKPRHDLKRIWAAVTARAELPGVRIHDIRHTFASYGAAGGLGLPIVGKLLGHTQVSTTQRYAHLADDPLRRASNQIGAAIDAAMKQKPAAQVINVGLQAKRGR